MRYKGEDLRSSPKKKLFLCNIHAGLYSSNTNELCNSKLSERETLHY